MGSVHVSRILTGPTRLDTTEPAVETVQCLGKPTMEQSQLDHLTNLHIVKRPSAAKGMVFVPSTTHACVPKSSQRVGTKKRSYNILGLLVWGFEPPPPRLLRSSPQVEMDVGLALHATIVARVKMGCANAIQTLRDIGVAVNATNIITPGHTNGLPIQRAKPPMLAPQDVQQVYATIMVFVHPVEVAIAVLFTTMLRTLLLNIIHHSAPESAFTTTVFLIPSVDILCRAGFGRQPHLYSRLPNGKHCLHSLTLHATAVTHRHKLNLV